MPIYNLTEFCRLSSYHSHERRNRCGNPVEHCIFGPRRGGLNLKLLVDSALCLYREIISLKGSGCFGVQSQSTRITNSNPFTRKRMNSHQWYLIILSNPTWLRKAKEENRLIMKFATHRAVKEGPLTIDTFSFFSQERILPPAPEMVLILINSSF